MKTMLTALLFTWVLYAPSCAREVTFDESLIAASK
jgi:hypothetical protein